MILTQSDIDDTSKIFGTIFSDAVLVHSRIVPGGVRVRVVYEDDERNQTLVIDEEHIRAVDTPEEYRVLVTDAAKDHRFRVKLARVLGP